jgi:DNA modification methylase
LPVAPCAALIPNRDHRNKLYYGENYEVLKMYIRDESVDLIYLDPPFNSRQDYNVLFAEKDGSQSSSQIHAFEDTWEWNIDAERSYQHIVEMGGRVADAMRAFRTFLGGSDMMAYLAMMAPRLVELRRVLKETGSIYLHCDPTASHYLKILMDAAFGPQLFRNEIIWKRSHAHSEENKALSTSDESLTRCCFQREKRQSGIPFIPLMTRNILNGIIVEWIRTGGATASTTCKVLAGRQRETQDTK